MNKVPVASRLNEESKMKRFSLKQLLVMVFIGLMTIAGTSLGDEPPGEGLMKNAENTTGQGDQDRARDHSCQELLGVAVDEEEDPIHLRIRARDGSCGDGPGPNQNPEPSWGESQYQYNK